MLTLIIPEPTTVCPICGNEHITLPVRYVYEIGTSGSLDLWAGDSASPEDAPYAEWLNKTSPEERWVLAKKLECYRIPEPIRPLNPAAWPIIFLAGFLILAVALYIGGFFSVYAQAVSSIYNTFLAFFGIPLGACAGYLHGTYKLTREQWERKLVRVREENWMIYRMWEQNLYVCPFANEGTGHVFMAGRAGAEGYEPVPPEYHYNLITRWIADQRAQGDINDTDR